MANCGRHLGQGGQPRRSAWATWPPERLPLDIGANASKNPPQPFWFIPETRTSFTSRYSSAVMPVAKVQQTFERLCSSKIASADVACRCTIDEIQQIENALKIRLPSAYREFLSLCGKGAGDFLVGTDWTYPSVLSLNQSASQLLHECGDHLKLSPSDYVFAMHQGYQFLFFDSQVSDDPPVFVFVEGEDSSLLVFDSFSNWFLQCVEDEIATCAELDES